MKSLLLIPLLFSLGGVNGSEPPLFEEGYQNFVCDKFEEAVIPGTDMVKVTYTVSNTGDEWIDINSSNLTYKVEGSIEPIDYKVMSKNYIDDMIAPGDSVELYTIYEEKGAIPYTKDYSLDLAYYKTQQILDVNVISYNVHVGEKSRFFYVNIQSDYLNQHKDHIYDDLILSMQYGDEVHSVKYDFETIKDETYAWFKIGNDFDPNKVGDIRFYSHCVEHYNYPSTRTLTILIIGWVLAIAIIVGLICLFIELFKLIFIHHKK